MGLIDRNHARDGATGQAGRGKARPGRAGQGRHGRRGGARRGKAGQGGARQAWHGMAGQGRHGMARRGQAGRGGARSGVAGLGWAWQGRQGIYNAAPAIRRMANHGNTAKRLKPELLEKRSENFDRSRRNQSAADAQSTNGRS